MTTVVADARPGALNIPFRPGNTLSVELTWPTGDLTGRTFESSLGGPALDLTVLGDVMTIEASAVITAAVTTPAAWLLTETTDSASNDILIGTWAPSDDPGTPTSLSLTVTTGDVDVDVTVVSGQSSIVALAARQGTVTTWRAADAWDRFAMTPVTLPTDSPPVLTTDDGFGVATHGAADGGNERRIYYLEHTDGIADCEVRLDFDLEEGNCQAGIALRGDDGEAVIVWSNVIFGVNSSLLQGLWEFDGESTSSPPFFLNQASDSIAGFKVPVATASGDGTTVTVRTERPHNLVAGLATLVGVGSFGQITVATVPTDTSFTFASSTAGTWTGGTVSPVFTPGRRKVAVRLIGDEVTFKQWLPGEDEPAWDDADRAQTNTLPATLDGSGAAPNATGKIGILVAHLSDDGVIRFNDLQVTNLDPLGAEPPTPVVDDTKAFETVGLLTARVDDLTPYRTGLWTPADHGVLAWAYDIQTASGATSAANQTIYLIRLNLRDQVTISNIVWALSGGATSPVSNQNHVGLYSPAGTRLATAGVDASTSTAGLKTTAITPVLVGPGFVWVALLFNASTPPQISRCANGISAAGMNLGLTAATARVATAGTGQTSLPASITPSSNTLHQNSFWAAVS